MGRNGGSNRAPIRAPSRDTPYLRTVTPSSIVPYISMLLPDEPTGVLAPPCAQAAHNSTAMAAQAARMIFIGLCFPDKTRVQCVFNFSLAGLCGVERASATCAARRIRHFA